MKVLGLLVVFSLCLFVLSGAWGLEGIANLDRFYIPKNVMTLLEKNHFVICPASHWQPFFVYEENAYQSIPNFVTIDSVLHLYHLFFNFALRKLEEERILPLVEDFTRRLLYQTIKTYSSLQPGELKSAALKNVAYTGVAANLLGIKVSLPPDAQSLVTKEINLIKGKKGLLQSFIFPYAIDYTQFASRGHYARNENLKRYFMVMMWYGLVPFSPAYRDSNGNLRLSREVALQAMLLVNDIYSHGLVNSWSRIFTPIGFFVGLSDDLTVKEVRDLMISIYGKKYKLKDLADPGYLSLFIDRFIKLKKPKIKPKIAHLAGNLPSLPDPDSSQFRMMGQRYTPDSEILQELAHPMKRPVPCGLDVMAVIGSKRALEIIDDGYSVYGLPEEFKNVTWEEYAIKREELKERFASLDESSWMSNIYLGWLWVLKGLFEPIGEEYPPFMRNSAWKDRIL
ncbi:MAG: DUF3160 domain-containing protein, partial [Synergistetes bacterium]|nr:DUF3160 domain-containing protein [Synergistota bacterium]